VRRTPIVLIAALALVGCGQSEENLAEENLAIVASSPGTIGTHLEQRVLIGLVDPETSESLASPDLEVTATFTGPTQQVVEVPAEFLWTIEDVRGLYVTRVSLDTPGSWSVALRPAGMGPTPPTPFVVTDDLLVPEVGGEAPVVATRTSDKHPLEELTSDPDPEPAFYALSLDEALTNGLPTVVVFATPAFCTSQTCGPLLDQVQALSSDHPDVNFLHVEIYENLDAATFEELRTVAAVTEWGLPSEPWVFFIDGAGMVTARMEGAASEAEINAAISSMHG
jgi:uncharacterized protein YcfL